MSDQGIEAQLGWTAFPTALFGTSSLPSGSAARRGARRRHRHRPSGPRRLPSRASGDPDPARARRGARTLGDQRGEPAQRGRARRAPAAGLPLHADRERRRRRAGERGRRHPRGAVRARGGRGPARPARGPVDADRHPHGHREGLLPQSGDRRDRPRPPRHPGGSRRREPAALDARLARARARCSGGPRGAGGLTVLCCDNMASNGRTLHGLVRQFARAGRPRSRRLDRGRGPLPEQHGRPDRPGGDGGLARPRGGASWACATRRR